MVDKEKVTNFLQDFGCAKLEQLQILFESEKDNFKSILMGDAVSKKDDIFVHNTKKIDNTMLIALDILCKYKKQKRLLRYYKGYNPVSISFLTTENLLYNIIVAENENRNSIVKLVNSYPIAIPQADKLILAFPNAEDMNSISCDIPFLYTSYPKLEVLNNEEIRNKKIDWFSNIFMVFYIKSNGFIYLLFFVY